MSDYSLHLKLPFCKYRFECKMQGEMLSTCSNCEHWFECSKFLGYHARRSSYANTVINEYPDGNYEVVLYDREFPLLLEECNRPKSDIPHGRKFNVQKGSSYVGEILIPKKDNVTLFEFCESLERSSQRAQDNFYGYGLSNDWHYFLTLTFSPDKVNRFDDDAVKSLWSNWLQEVRKDNPDIKALVVPERHKNGAIHFHGFLADCPNISLSQAYYPKDYKYCYYYFFCFIVILFHFHFYSFNFVHTLLTIATIVYVLFFGNTFFTNIAIFHFYISLLRKYYL